MFTGTYRLNLVVLGLILSNWSYGQDAEKQSAFREQGRTPASIITIEKLRALSRVEPEWYRHSRSLTLEGKRVEQPIQVFRWSLRQPEAPSESSESRSIAFEKRLILRN